MNVSHDIAGLAKLLGDPARTNMLVALMSGKALTAGELALCANISAQTASHHLKKLLAMSVVTCEQMGRHRYYHLATADVAQALESLGVVVGAQFVQPPRHTHLDKDLCYARTCYDHLAGELGVKITMALLQQKLLEKQNSSFVVTKQGCAFFLKQMQIDVQQLMQQRRQFVKPCLDWTQRQHHIAGSLGAAILNYLLESRLVLQSKSKSRVMLLTTKGRHWLQQVFNIRNWEK